MQRLFQGVIGSGRPAPRACAAAKAAPQDAVYSSKDVGGRLQGSEPTPSTERPRSRSTFSTEKRSGCLVKRVCFRLPVSEHALYLTFDAQTLSGALTWHRVAGTRLDLKRPADCRCNLRNRPVLPPASS